MSTEESREPRTIRRMFAGIAPRYDLLNHLLSGNQDRRWRRIAAEELAPAPGERLLDLCGGTGDLSVALAAAGGETIICCDFAHPMLQVATRKFQRKRMGDRCVLLEADGLRLPVPDATFDGVTVGFGVRNFADLDLGLKEILRVLRPGGRLVILEFSQPDGPVLSRLYRFYLRRVLPRIGGGASGDRGAYGYLASTIAGFPEPAALAGRIRETGFAACGWKLASGGIVAVHTAFT